MDKHLHANELKFHVQDAIKEQVRRFRKKREESDLPATQSTSTDTAIAEDRSIEREMHEDKTQRERIRIDGNSAVKQELVRREVPRDHRRK